MPPTGVLILNLGGPDKPESVKPFLLELFRDPDVLNVPGGAPVRNALAWLIATRRAKQVVKNYLEVGWSPLLPRTLAQERALEQRLNELAGARDGLQKNDSEPAWLVRTAMRYWHPRASVALAELVAKGVTRIVALPLYPHYSRATTASSLGELREVVARDAPKIELVEITSYATDPAYVAALARCVEDGIAAARQAAAAAGSSANASLADREPLLLFSAHGLPQRIVDAGDPYEKEIHATMAAVLAKLGWKGESMLSFQSRAGPVKWLEPSTEHAIGDLARRGVKRVVVVPISFVSDHIETVHEIDILLGTQAKAQGIETFVRTPALDVRPDFVDALAALVRARAALPAAPQGGRTHAVPT